MLCRWQDIKDFENGISLASSISIAALVLETHPAYNLWLLFQLYILRKVTKDKSCTILVAFCGFKDSADSQTNNGVTYDDLMHKRASMRTQIN